MLLSACGGAPSCATPLEETPAAPAAESTVRPTPTPLIPFDMTPVPVGDMSSALDPAWSRGSFMLIHVRSYKDSNGDGDGDFEGLIQSLDYLRDLGIRGLWLMPIYPSWDNDHGYMVEDFRGMDSNYGSFETLDRLIAEAHKRGIGILLDYTTDASASTEQTGWDRDGDPDILYFAAPGDGNYRFSVDASNVLAPILTVRAAQ